MNRPDIDQYFLSMARLVSSRGTCLRRAVGCVLVSSRNHVLATGYNGVAAGVTHCLERPCEGADACSGTQLDKCNAIHAEQNALLQCKDVHEIETCYCTTAPCVTCTKLLMNTGCKRIVFEEDYPSSGKALWISSFERAWVRSHSTLAAEVKEAVERSRLVSIGH